MLKKTPTLFFLMISLSFSSSAQKRLAGYILTQNSDTVRGFIRDGTDAELGLKIEFRQRRNDISPNLFTPSDLRGFGFANGREFRRQVFAVSQAGDSAAVFAKQVVRGKIDLFIWRRFKKNEGDMFLINNHSMQLAHLSEPQLEVIDLENGERVIRKDKRYITLLNYIKGDSSQRKIRYTEERMVKDVLTYNKHFQDQYPVTHYREKRKFSFDLAYGLPVRPVQQESFFRASIYMNKSFPENSRRLSYFRGVSFRHWNDNRTFDSNVNFDNRNYRLQYLSLIPIGINYHASSRIVRPYIYAGIGLGIAKRKNHVAENFVYRSSEEELDYFPTLNAGVGVRIKTGPGFIAAELTPSVDGVFFNLGLSI